MTLMTRMGDKNSELILKEEAYAILGACFEVQNRKGSGFHEPVYQECLAIEFDYRGIPAIAQPALELEYRGRILQQRFFPDFICYGQVVLEIQAVSCLIDEHRAQVLNYLNATRLNLGLLVNFGHYPQIEHERLVLTDKAAAQAAYNEEVSL